MVMPSQRATPTIQDILKSKRRNRMSIDIALNPTLKPKIQQLEKELRQARRQDERENRTPQAPAIAKELEKLETEFEESVVSITFEDIGRSRFEALVESHPPTDAQKKQYGDGLTWNPETIAPVLISACAAEPKISPEEAEEICREWSTGDVQLLFNAALQVCLETASVPFTRTVFDATPSSEESLSIVPTEESLTPGS